MLSLLQMSFPNKDSITTFSQLTEICKYQPSSKHYFRILIFNIGLKCLLNPIN